MAQKVIYKGSPIKDASGTANQCYLCGSTENITIEHLIPKVIFKNQDPQKYIKISSCQRCNQAKGRDEEYISRFLQLSSKPEEARTALGNFIKDRTSHTENGIWIPRRINKNRGIIEDMKKRMKRTKIKTKGNIFLLREIDTIKIDPIRLKNFYKRIAKGLWCYNTDRHFDWNKFNISCLNYPLALNPNIHDEYPIADIFQQAEFAQYWKNLFSYSGLRLEGGSAWVLVFYSSHLGLIVFENKAHKV